MTYTSYTLRRKCLVYHQLAASSPLMLNTTSPPAACPLWKMETFVSDRNEGRRFGKQKARTQLNILMGHGRESPRLGICGK